jgi:hypothetical protein
MVGAFTSPEVDFGRGFVFVAGTYTLLIDLPLCVVADTLTLPYTLADHSQEAVNLAKQKRLEEDLATMRAADAKAPSGER